MSLYRLREKISYQLHSVGRHGVHSPFVYDLIEQVLLNKARISTPIPEVVLPALLPAPHEQLLRRIAVYYGCERLAYLENDNWIPAAVTPGKSTPDFDTLLLAPVAQLHTLHSPALASYLGEGCILACSGLYNSAEHTEHWQRLAADPAVTLSLDLFELGLLFFRKDFLVKQAFRLKF